MPTEISGSTGVNKIQDGTVVNADINSSAAIAGSKLVMPTGSVIQVVYAAAGSSNVTVSPSSSSYADGPMEISITPTSTSNKILVFGQQGLRLEFSGVHARAGIRVERKIGSGSYDVVWNTANLREMVQAYDRGTSDAKEFNQEVPFSVLDTPNTTSALTYKITGGLHNDSNVSSMQMWKGGYGSTITAMEIAG